MGGSSAERRAHWSTEIVWAALWFAIGAAVVRWELVGDGVFVAAMFVGAGAAVWGGTVRARRAGEAADADGSGDGE